MLEDTADAKGILSGRDALKRVMDDQCLEPMGGRKARADDQRTAYAPAVQAQRDLQERQLAAEQTPRSRGRELTLLERVEALERRMDEVEGTKQ